MGNNDIVKYSSLALFFTILIISCIYKKKDAKTVIENYIKTKIVTPPDFKVMEIRVIDTLRAMDILKKQMWIERNGLSNDSALKARDIKLNSFRRRYSFLSQQDSIDLKGVIKLVKLDSFMIAGTQYRIDSLSKSASNPIRFIRYFCKAKGKNASGIFETDSCFFYLNDTLGVVKTGEANKDEY